MSLSSRAYKDAIHLLNSLQSNAATIEAIRKSGLKLNAVALTEMREYLGRVGHSTEDLNRLNVLHITGTKGKGSTTAFCDSLLRSLHRNHPPPSGAPLRVGMYTSPHLVAVRERIRINGVPISEELFARYFFEVWERLEADQKVANPLTPVKPVYFRYLTLLAYHAFLSERVDATLLEVGIGGAFDSTNLVPRPLATGVTSLGLDHTAVLGDTLAEVAWNKGGIYKEGVPALTVEQKPEGLEMLRSRAKELKASSFTVVPIHPEIPSIKLGLAGLPQRSNASLALSLVTSLLASPYVPEVLSHIPAPSVTDGSPLLPALREGLERARWPGRCQLIEEEEEGEKTRWWLDGAHTKESLEGCGKWFWGEMGAAAATKKEGEQKTKRVLIFNCTHGRSSTELLAALFSEAPASVAASKTERGRFFDEVVFSTNTTYASGVSKGDLSSRAEDTSLSIQRELSTAFQQLTPSFPAERVHVVGSIEEAVALVRQRKESEDGKREEADVLVTGSLHLVGGVMEVAGLTEVGLRVD